MLMIFAAGKGRPEPLMRDVLMNRRPQTSFFIVQARVIVRTNAPFVFFEMLDYQYSAFSVRFCGFTRTFLLSFSLFRSRYLMRMS